MVKPWFVAADVGNARIKLGLFEEKGDILLFSEQPDRCCMEKQNVPFFPLRTLPLPGKKPKLDAIATWLADVAPAGLHWWISSVNRPAAALLIDWLRAHRPADRVTLLASGDLPLKVRLPRPDMVGIDRLVDAVAVNRLRRAREPAAIVDVGSAITVDLVSAAGEFLGGAILPGIEMAARALHHFTDLLPLVDASELESPPSPVGDDTLSAIRAGLYWGAVGAIRQLVEQLHKAATGGRAEGWGGSSTAASTKCEAASGRALQVFLTGGAGAAVADLLGPDARYVPDLTLTGIALAAKASLCGFDRPRTSG